MPLVVNEEVSGTRLEGGLATFSGVNRWVIVSQTLIKPTYINLLRYKTQQLIDLYNFDRWPMLRLCSTLIRLWYMLTMLPP